jgi:hypothetical protein
VVRHANARKPALRLYHIMYVDVTFNAMVRLMQIVQIDTQTASTSHANLKSQTTCKLTDLDFFAWQLDPQCTLQKLRHTLGEPVVILILCMQYCDIDMSNYLMFKTVHMHARRLQTMSCEKK